MVDGANEACLAEYIKAAEALHIDNLAWERVKDLVESPSLKLNT